MKAPAEKRLFWYLRDGIEFNLEDPVHLDMYIQQILSHGKAEDVQKMLRIVPEEKFRESFNRIKRFLPREVRRFWEDGLGDMGAFYLTGGTALAAFYLRHRKSQDLGFFTASEEVILPFSFATEGRLKEKGFNVHRQRGLHSFVELRAEREGQSTNLHLAQDSPFRFEEPVESKEFPGMRIDTLIDISTNKLLALFGRATLRDFIDVYFLTKEHFCKSDLLEKARLKDPGLDTYWLGVAFERIHEFSQNSADMLFLARPCSIDELRSFYDEWKREIYRGLSDTSG